jgi:hypothetical protein
MAKAKFNFARHPVCEACLTELRWAESDNGYILVDVGTLEPHDQTCEVEVAAK